VPRVAAFLFVLLELLWLGDAPLELGLELPLLDLGADEPDEEGLAPAAELEAPVDAEEEGEDAAEPDDEGAEAPLEGELEPLDPEDEPSLLS